MVWNVNMSTSIKDGVIPLQGINYQYEMHIYVISVPGDLTVKTKQ